jgi:uncharacterized protein (TIGR02001 family)
MKIITLVFAAFFSSAVIAQTSATITAASDYLFTGVSQTDSNPTLQGSLDHAFDNGIYLGAWFSNVDFGHDDPARVEQDYYAGWVWQVSEAVALNVGALTYVYTSAPSEGYDYTNYLIGVTLYENTVINFYYADDEDVYGEDTDGDGENDRGGRHSWLEIKQTIPLNDNWNLQLSADYDKNEEVADYNGSETGDDYWHWQIGVVTEYMGIKYSLAYSDTDIDSSDDPDENADGRIVFSMAKTFDF